MNDYTINLLKKELRHLDKELLKASETVEAIFNAPQEIIKLRKNAAEILDEDLSHEKKNQKLKPLAIKEKELFKIAGKDAFYYIKKERKIKVKINALNNDLSALVFRKQLCRGGK